mmetsp:Transcript_56331/g.131936  ORF Transcript_56331/g.131936 Transcript_56331/m.131936 type:complete len:320 (+) Transcript_56331:1493-2452(+)
MGRFEISSMKRSYLSVSRSQRTTSRIVSLLERRIAESTATFLSCSDLHFMSASRVPSSACLIALVRREAPPSGSLPVPDLMPSAEICDIAFASCPEASSPCSSTSSAAAGGMRESFSKRAHIMLSLRFPSATSKHRTWLRSGPTSTSPSPPPPPPPPPPLPRRLHPPSTVAPANRVDTNEDFLRLRHQYFALRGAVAVNQSIPNSRTANQKTGPRVRNMWSCFQSPQHRYGLRLLWIDPFVFYLRFSRQTKTLSLNMQRSSRVSTESVLVPRTGMPFRTRRKLSNRTGCREEHAGETVRGRSASSDESASCRRRREGRA